MGFFNAQGRVEGGGAGSGPTHFPTPALSDNSTVRAIQPGRLVPGVAQHAACVTPLNPLRILLGHTVLPFFQMRKLRQGEGKSGHVI